MNDNNLVKIASVALAKAMRESLNHLNIDLEMKVSIVLTVTANTLIELIGPKETKRVLASLSEEIPEDLPKEETGSVH